MTGYTREEYVALRSPLRSSLEPTLRHSSHDSEESLRALEMEQGPSSAPSSHGRSVVCEVFQGKGLTIYYSGFDPIPCLGSTFSMT